jgi:hypothetical protein
MGISMSYIVYFFLSWELICPELLSPTPYTRPYLRKSEKFSPAAI